MRGRTAEENLNVFSLSQERKGTISSYIPLLQAQSLCRRGDSSWLEAAKGLT